MFPDSIPVLRSKNLILREVELDNLEALEEILAYQVGQNLTGDPEGVIQKLKADFHAGLTINWGLYLKSELIGCCGYFRGFENNVGEIGYVLREKFRRNGYMLEAISLIVDYGFDQLNLKMITAYTKDGNKPSVELLKNIGFLPTDTLDEGYRRYEIYG